MVLNDLFIAFNRYICKWIVKRVFMHVLDGFSLHLHCFYQQATPVSNCFENFAKHFPSQPKFTLGFKMMISLFIYVFIF